MKKLTLDILKEMKPFTIFDSGTFIDNPEGCNIARTGKSVPWIAKRGRIHDWAIYCQNPHYVNSGDFEVIMFGMGGVWNNERVAQVGEKICSENNIKKLVECDDEAFAMYRY